MEQDEIEDMEWLARAEEEEKKMLEHLCGVTRLEDACTLEVVVNTTGTSISHIGEMMPNLTELKLNNSVIDSLRDLGTSLGNLQVLWVSRCGLKSLDGVASISTLKELYASFNEIEDLFPLQGMEELQVLDVEGNSITSLQALEGVMLCPKLDTLTLTGNGLCDSTGYTQKVLEFLPNLKFLDEEEITRKLPPRKVVGKAGESQDTIEVALVHSALKHARSGVDSSDFQEIETSSCDGREPSSSGTDRPPPCRIRPATSGWGIWRGGGTSRPGTAHPRVRSPGVMNAPLPSAGLYWRKNQLHRPSTSAPARQSRSAGAAVLQFESDPADCHDSSTSVLTVGESSMGGNIARALRRRKGADKHSRSGDRSPTTTGIMRSSVVDMREVPGRMDVRKDDNIMDALREWKITAAKLALSPEDGASDLFRSADHNSRMPPHDAQADVLILDEAGTRTRSHRLLETHKLVHNKEEGSEAGNLTDNAGSQEQACAGQIQGASGSFKQSQSAQPQRQRGSSFSYRRRVQSAAAMVTQSNERWHPGHISVDGGMSSDQTQAVQRNASTPMDNDHV